MQITNQNTHNVIATARYEAGSNPEIRLNHDFNRIYRIAMIFLKNFSTTPFAMTGKKKSTIFKFFLINRLKFKIKLYLCILE